MRFTAIPALFFFLALPVLAHAKNKKQATPNPAFVNAKVLGVHCDPGVDLDTCQGIIDGFRVSALDYTIRNCPTAIDEQTEEAHVECAPKDDADLMLFVSVDYSYDDAYGHVRTTLMTQMYCQPKLCPAQVNGGKITNADFEDGGYVSVPDDLAFVKLYKTYVETMLKYGAPKKKE